jgi:hypothetical protein
MYTRSQAENFFFFPARTAKAMSRACGFNQKFTLWGFLLLAWWEVGRTVEREAGGWGESL